MYKTEPQNIRNLVVNDIVYQKLLEKKAEVYNNAKLTGLIVGKKFRITIDIEAKNLTKKIDELIKQRIYEICDANSPNSPNIKLF